MHTIEPVSSAAVRGSTRSYRIARWSGRVAAIMALAVVGVLVAACGGGGRESTRSGWTEERVFFASGSSRLFGILALPKREGSHAAVALLSGSGRGGVDTALLALHAHRLAAAGFAVLRYDPPGVGRSSGTLAFETLADRTQEAIAAAEFLRRRPGINPDEVGLWGESQGGWVTQMAAAESPDVAFIVSLSGSGVSVAEQQVYSVRAQSRAAGLSPSDIAKATLMIRLLIDGQLAHDRYRSQNQAELDRLGPGPWDNLAALVYAAKPVPAATGLARTIAILEQIRGQPWAQFLALDTYLAALEAIPPAQAARALAAAEQSLRVDPRAFLTRVHQPVLAFFGEDDTLVPAKRSAALYRRYLRQARNNDGTIIVVPNANHSLNGLEPGYWHTLTNWLTDQTGA